ncbi:hypothetical protein ACWCV9_19520 [Streptomyces sp. NPDC001606]
MAVLALPALVVAWGAAIVVRAMTSDYPLGGGPEKVSCAEALAFGGARLPQRAYESRCTVQAWQDTSYDADFRMPRADVWAWLRHTYPHAPKPRTDLCAAEDSGPVDFCVDMNTDATAPQGVDANAVQISVTYEGPATARVRFSAFTV